MLQDLRNGSFSQSWPLTDNMFIFLEERKRENKTKWKPQLYQGTKIFQVRALSNVEKHVFFRIRSQFKIGLILVWPSLRPRWVCFLKHKGRILTCTAQGCFKDWRDICSHMQFCEYCLLEIEGIQYILGTHPTTKSCLLTSGSHSLSRDLNHKTYRE